MATTQKPYHCLVALPTGKNLKMGDWLLARANIKPGDASATLPVLGHTVNALQE